MNDLKKYKKYAYSLKLLSNLILSPRGNQAFYLDAGDFSDAAMQGFDTLENGKIKIIYPFYQYGAYARYMPREAQYYIPGSAVKGALGLKNSMVDDMRVNNSDIVLRRVYKVQYRALSAEKNSQPKYDVFFPNVAVEMLKANAKAEGEMFCEEHPGKYLSAAQENTKKKLKQWLLQIGEISKKIEEKSFNAITELEQARKSVENMLKSCEEQPYLLILGGYKGLLLSGVFDDQERAQKENYGVYFAEENFLPYGLAHIQLLVRQ